MKRLVMVAAAALLTGCGSSAAAEDKSGVGPASVDSLLMLTVPTAPVDRGPCLPFEIRLRIGGCPMVLV